MCGHRLCRQNVNVVTTVINTKLTEPDARTIRLIGDVASVQTEIAVLNVSAKSMPQSKEQLHEKYVEYITEFRRLVNEKHGEQLKFDFYDEYDREKINASQNN